MEGQTSLRRRASSESEAVDMRANKKARSSTAGTDSSRAGSPVVSRPKAPALGGPGRDGGGRASGGLRHGGMGAAAAAEQRQAQLGARAADTSVGGLTAKAVSDKFAHLKSKMAQLEDAVKLQNTGAAEMKTHITVAQNDIKLLDEYSQKQSQHIKALRAEVTELTDRVEVFEGKLAAVLESAAAMHLGEQGGVAEGQVESGGKARNNSLQGAIRACVHSIMGIELGAALPDPVGGGVYWEEKVTHIGTGEEDVVREQVLHPDWERSWDENKHQWLHKVVLLIQARGWDYQKTLSREQIAKLSQAEIGEGVKTAFDWMVRKYEREHRGDDGKAKKDAAYKAKITARKTKKAARRTKVRDKVPDARTPQFDHQFLPQYQSSDESGYEEIEAAARRTSEDSSDRDGPPGDGAANACPRRTRRQKILIAHPGAWRLQTTTDTMIELDEAAQEDDDGDEAGAARYQRRRGEPRSWQESALPGLKRVKNKVFIPRCMVNMEWLQSADGKGYDSPKFIADHAVEQQNDAEVGGGEGSEGQEQEQ
ncbi:hypothetical protein C8T65DRAFT_747251 [Cerioporus squamosus]|nr:hypothetical protein C8T65DRAFT_747251 [Cerioporus squamosus]